MTETVHVLELLDYREVESSADRLVLEMDNRPDLANVRGALQGGLVATLIDIAAGMLAGSASGFGYDVTTADLNIHFLAPIMGTARAEAKIVRAGKRLIVTSVDVTDITRDRLAARATLTFAVLEPR
ncbi:MULTISPECIES: PaaI family thioesterase [unclassified Mycolicibacterium]|uniref:PaaI family thioesterase n=1 Tax=unclassified Mycolicibacterium TaxID=2636767 RepID=UPI0012DE05FC|nr:MULTISPECIES: PaaI family thioesterase [unclassified Mycolicibacterium]MUL80425.1 PaaI family thioesterase [Mycolicibacterium sp. CBMA 329]MUL86192.1 PaaI family thioesterase [Mycolicibacterium sp. CBMA 331]MUM01145.1 PaaI family thioesterase [Mycolicibacterium sp. CBMA 334]MUM30261.1 PaaI family thioesterase [Mycolicibacterium sp. CBMA 295]MUM36488.1 PaaI family thioesterase [Mycolicibacterium sp. CBMA 247]